MFTRARLRLTLTYAALLGVTVLLVAGAIGALAVREARQTDDRELQIRAGSLLASLPPGPPVAPTGPPPFGPPDRPPRLEEQGLLDYVLLFENGKLLAPPPDRFSGLPDLASAEQAAETGKASYRTVTVQGSEVRIYNVPDARGGPVHGVIQVARSRYFVNAAVTNLAGTALVAGIAGLLISGVAGYWMAGRTLQPIANALERQRNFASDASHELRTPLTVMLTNAELLTLHPDRRLSEYQDVVADIIAETQRLSRLVADLLTLARADQGSAGLVKEQVDLSEVAAVVARQFVPLATAKGIGFQAMVGPRVFVDGDRDRLQQLAVILVDNAVRYTRSGGVVMRVEQRGSEAVLEVWDSGSGIAPEHLPHLFERFYRTDAARSTEEGGTGLGLALARWIAESHQGRIEVTSTLGRGSTFTLHLPATRAAPSAGIPEPVAAVQGDKSH
jgi:signal transduction histidine kinase